MARRYRYEYLMKKRAKERARIEKEERLQNLSGNEKKMRELIGWGLYIAVLVCAVHLVTTYVGQRTVVAGDSMLNTIHDKDNLIIDKFFIVSETQRDMRLLFSLIAMRKKLFISSAL